MSDLINKYATFVEAVTSTTSKDFSELSTRLQELSSNELGVNIPLLMTGSFGLSSEGGEFSEIVKKILFQGKPLNEENIFHMKRELGDIIFYWIDACISLGINPAEVIEENMKKLEARYPNGFTVDRSENRVQGDI